MRARVRAAAAALGADPYHYFPAWYRRSLPSDLAKRPIFIVGGWTEASERGRRGELDVRGELAAMPEYLLDGVLWRAASALRRIPGVDPARFGALKRAALATVRRGTQLLSIDQWLAAAKATPGSLSLLAENTPHARKYARLARENGLDALYTSEAMRLPEFRALARGPSNDLLGDMPARIEEYLALEDAFIDAESVDVLHRTLLYRMTLAQAELEPIVQHPFRKYFPRELIPLTDRERLIDIGAFTGDSVRHFFIATDGKFEQVISLEPDDHNFFFLEKYRASLPPADAARLVCRKEGAWSERTRLTFHATASVGSSLDAGGVSIDVTSIDALADEYGPPTYIKCEAEGADREVLIGGARTIRAHRPRMAITAYHLPDDYLALTALLPDYRLALRHYTVDHSGTTIYAY